MAKPIKRGHMWYSDYREGGRRIRRPLSKDKREAQRMLDARMLLRRAEKYGDVPYNMDWGLFRDKYLDYSKTNKDPSTFWADNHSIKLLEEVYRPKHLREVTPEFLERARVTWSRTGKTHATIVRAIVAVKTAMRKAEDWKYIGPQNWRIVKAKQGKGRDLFYTVDEVKRLLSLSAGLWRTSILLMYRGGLRAGEAFNIEWKDIDFVNNRILIRRKELPDGTIWTPKGKKEGIVPIDDLLMADLSQRRQAQGFVLGKIRTTRRVFYQGIKDLLRNAELQGSPHTLRHTFASHLAQAGLPLIKLRDLMRHSHVAMVEKYAHLSPESVKKSIEMLPKLND